ncbi:MAG: acyl-CoA dehydratase activase-related protein [Anaerovoracaceae bacterium]|jgi:predicted nucleotide-binding protein (sugar kinase/HSP70/actin superfamily)
MLLGVPGGLFFTRYEAGIREFFRCLEEGGFLKIKYSTQSNREILEYGLHHCVDEACLPIKIFHGHVRKLQEDCDYVVIPRLMKCQSGHAICPKFAGLPEMVRSGTGCKTGVFTGPLYLNNGKQLSRRLMSDGRSLGIPDKEIKRALKRGEFALKERKNRNRGVDSGGDSGLHVAILGHSYNLNDPFINMNVLKKLKDLGITGVLADDLYGDKDILEMDFKTKGFIKDPYWISFRENYVAALSVADRGTMHGAIYLSSFGCGLDSFIIDIVRKVLGDIPLLVLKLDEHSGEAGLITRLEAYAELLERKNRNADNISPFR